MEWERCRQLLLAWRGTVPRTGADGAMPRSVQWVSLTVGQDLVVHGEHWRFLVIVGERRHSWSRLAFVSLKGGVLIDTGGMRRIVHACCATAWADGHIEPGEYQLLRAITASLSCPMPLLLPEGRGVL